uniref:Uncharacterized protein n=1 Tax=Rhipicephalus zambeziensis TaxID=60191 RepID=A0A224Y9H9_9ACAR
MDQTCIFIFIMMLVVIAAISPGNFTCRHRQSQCTGVRRPSCFESSTQLRFVCSVKYEHCQKEWLSHCTRPFHIACWDYKTHCDCLCYLPLGGKAKRRRQDSRYRL